MDKRLSKCDGCGRIRCHILEYMYETLGEEPSQLTEERYLDNINTRDDMIRQINLRQFGIKSSDVAQELNISVHSASRSLYQMFRYGYPWIEEVKVTDDYGKPIDPQPNITVPPHSVTKLFKLNPAAISYRRKFGSFLIGPMCLKDKRDYWSGEL